jgi:hypothetical protein
MLFQCTEMPGVLAVKPDTDKVDMSEKDNHGSGLSAANLGNFSDAVSNHSSSSGENEFWLVRMEKPGVEVVTKAQMVDHYTQTLMKVLGKYVASSSTLLLFCYICPVDDTTVLSSQFLVKRMHKSAYITFHGRGIMASAVTLTKNVPRS